MQATMILGDMRSFDSGQNSKTTIKNNANLGETPSIPKTTKEVLNPRNLRSISNSKARDSNIRNLLSK
jgi:hypothetical protein